MEGERSASTWEPMLEVQDASELRSIVEDLRCGGATIGLVPTMGALHAGHLRLVACAASENEVVVMSLFVNPTQFGPQEDFSRYPRDFDRDRALARDAGVDILFVPDTATMYPSGPENQQIWVDPGQLAGHLCGASRPGHFRGVATVVAKLFNFVQPDRAYFGQKDGQQAVIVKHLARDLSFDVEVRVIPTVREPDGLALSSRNVYLNPAERAQAIALSGALRWAREAIEAGQRDAESLRAGMRTYIGRAAPLGRLDYAEIVRLDDLQPADGTIGDVMLAVAVYFGSTRLIDNLVLGDLDA